MNWRLEGGATWVSPTMQRTIEKMRSRNLTITGFRGRNGIRRFVLSNNEIIHSQTIAAMVRRGLLETIAAPPDAKDGDVYYRLKVQ